MEKRSPFVFLDRDGTLVVDVGYGHKAEHYELLPGVIDALHCLAAAGYRFALVTNQSGIARGIFRREDFDLFNGLLLAELSAAGITIVETFLCPHEPSDGCDCRKPSPKHLFDARDRLGADLAASWMIGDHASDVGVAARAGCRGILVLTGHGEEERDRLGDLPVDAVVPDLAAAARHILSQPRRKSQEAAAVMPRGAEGSPPAAATRDQVPEK